MSGTLSRGQPGAGGQAGLVSRAGGPLESSASRRCHRGGWVAAGLAVVVVAAAAVARPAGVFRYGQVGWRVDNGLPVVLLYGRAPAWRAPGEGLTGAGRHHLVAVHVGLFDDASGLVQVSGPGLAARQHVVAGR